MHAGLSSTVLIVVILSAGGLYLLLRWNAPTLAWWILNGTIAAAVLNKTWGVLAESWVDSVAILPVMDDFNHAIHPNVSFLASCLHTSGLLTSVFWPG